MKKGFWKSFFSKLRKNGFGWLKRSAKSWWLWVFTLLLLSTTSFVYWVYEPFVCEREVFIVGVKVGDVALTGLSRDHALNALEERFEPCLDQTLVIVDNGFRFFCQPREWGFSFDYEAMLAEAFALGHEGSILRQWIERRNIKRDPVEHQVKIITDRVLLGELIRLLEMQVNVEPIKSNIIVNKEGQVKHTPSRLGRQLNTHRLLEALSEAIISKERKELTLPVDQVNPALVDEEVAGWGLTSVISFYTTEFDEGNLDRTNNLKVSVARLHGALLPSKQQFSFNRWVGPRDLKHGYKEAPVVLENELVPGIGGGICQVSTTLYNAWLLAGFKVSKRHNHSLPITYVEMGRDAAVVYGAQDLVFTNPLKTPILISAVIEGNSLTVALLGKGTRKYRYTLEPRIVERIPPQLVRVEDPSLEQGHEVIEEQGQEGFKVELWRKSFLDGEEVGSERLGLSVYKPKPRLIRVGLGNSTENNVYSEE